MIRQAAPVAIAKFDGIPCSVGREFDTFPVMNKTRNVSGAARSAFVLSESELRDLFTNALDNRERAILELMGLSGLRVTEVCTLEIARVDLDGRNVTVIGKYGKPRTVPISKGTADRLRHTIGRRARGYVFAGRKGSPHLQARSVQYLVRAAGERIDFKQLCPTLRYLNPHTLRHTAARRMKDHGFDYEEIARILGHADIAKVVFLYGTKTYKEIQKKAEAELFKL